MLIILVNKVVDPKRIIGKNGGPRRRRGARGHRLKKQQNNTSCFISISD
jgi:hypothetical protein